MDVLGEGQRAVGKGGRQCLMRGAEALGSENRGAQRGWEAGSPPATLRVCVCVCTCVCVQGGGGGEERVAKSA